MANKLQNVLPYLANTDQVCYARLDEIGEGTARGQRIISVFNGSGLQFTITPDRGMNLVDCSFRGIPMVFRTPGGYRGLTGDWLNDWAGGLMTTCGLRNVGSPSGTQGLHGQISAQSAEQLSIVTDDGDIRISGRLKEACIGGCNLELFRVISTAYGCNEIMVEDTVTNHGEKPEFTEILYHCNLGYPLVSPALKFELPEHDVDPRDDAAKAALVEWDQFPAPLEDFGEYCYRHTIPADENGWADMRIVNDEIGTALTISYDTATLPRIVEWKKPSKNCYVLGLEPTNGSLNGCVYDSENGFGKMLAPGESIRYRFKIRFESV